MDGGGLRGARTHCIQSCHNLFFLGRSTLAWETNLDQKPDRQACTHIVSFAFATTAMACIGDCLT